MGGAKFGKSLIQFSFAGRGLFPPCCFTEAKLVEVMKIMVPLEKVCAGTSALSASDPEAGHL